MDPNLAIAKPIAASPPGALPVQGLEMLFDRYLYQADLVTSSKDTNRRQLNQFKAWLVETNRLHQLDTLDRNDILAYKEDLVAQGKSGYTVSGYLSSVRNFFAWLEAEKVHPNITRNIRSPRKAKGHRKDCLTPEQVNTLLSSIDTNNLLGLRDFALINLLIRTGLRTIEVARAQVGDLSQESGQAVLWVQGKGRATKDDFVLLVDEALRPIRRYLSARHNQADDTPLFCSQSDRCQGQALTTRSISRIVKEHLRRIGLDSPRLSAHSLRHTAITLAIKNGARVEQAQAMARHSSIATTMIYAHNLKRVEEGAERYIDF